jgi:DNA polymerase-4
VAKITSDQAKPNGVLWVIPGREPEFLAPLDVRKMPGIGKVTEKRLHEMGIKGVFPPGTPMRDIIEFINTNARARA